MDEPPKEYKIVLVGNSAVGKTSVINRLIKKNFNEFAPTTLGAMFLTKEIEVDGREYKLQIWDTAGQERFKAIASLYYRDAHGIVLVYDVTSKKSFDGLQDWFKEIEEKGDHKVSTLIMGNKCDMIESQQVEFEVASKYAQDKKTSLVLTSAKDGQGIEDGFAILVRKIVDKSNVDFLSRRETSPTVLNKKDIEKVKKKDDKGCC